MTITYPDTDPMADVLLVEGDPTTGTALHNTLCAQGYRARWETSGQGCLAAIHRAEPDLVLLDLGLPDLDGVEVTRRIRAAAPTTVVVILTARDAELDVVIGLEAGADDYLTKPCRPAELLARLRAHLRRGQGIRRRTSTSDGYEVGALRVQPTARRCTIGGLEVELRAREFDLLARLAAAAGEAVRRETLMIDVWDEHWFGSTKTLDVHIAALRRRLAVAAGASGHPAPVITTLRKHGYRLELPAVGASAVGASALPAGASARETAR